MSFRARRLIDSPLAPSITRSSSKARVPKKEEASDELSKSPFLGAPKLMPRSSKDCFESLALQLNGVRLHRTLDTVPILFNAFDPSLLLWGVTTVPARIDELFDDGLLERYQSMLALLQLLVVAASPCPADDWVERLEAYMSSHTAKTLWKATWAYEGWGH